jgi:tartrate dehydrogenase/decarboxylase / D-malate dehydrogenase
MFEPVHGSAPGRAGTGTANPVAAVWAGAMLLNHVGEPEAGALLLRAIETVVADGPWTVDLVTPRS